MAVKLSPVFQDAQLDSSGNPYTGAQIFTYAAGSTTPQTTYKDSGGLTQHANPIVLNSRGEPPAPIWLTAGLNYKLYLTTPTDSDPPVTSVRVIDVVTGVNDTTSAFDEWPASGNTPTYISATSFSVSGDQTVNYSINRRLKTTNSGGTVYSRISVSSFGAGITTVTVVNDSGSLDSGLSAVSYGLINPSHPSLPGFSPLDGLLLFGSSSSAQVVGLRAPRAGAAIINGKITRSVSGSALTIALKTLGDADPSVGDPVFVLMPTVTGAVFDGGYAIRKATAALSLVISSGSKLGQVDAVASAIYSYLGDNAGTLVLGASAKFFGGISIQSSTAEGGAGAADAATTLYSTAAQTSIAWATLQRWKSTQTTAGTWAATTGEVQLYPFPFKIPKTTKITATGAFVKDWDTLWAELYIKGGGSSGAGSSTVNANGGGGGEAEEAWKTVDASSLAPSETVTIGAGGALVSSNTNAAGNAGGTTSFGSLVTAVGGGVAVSGNSGGSPAAGGTGGTGADIAFPGMPGQAGALSSAGTAINAAGGGRGAGVAGTAAAANSGAGGGPGTSASSSGAGAAGVGVVKEHYSEGA